MSICPSCAAPQLTAASKFCHQCGAPLATAGEAADQFVGRVIGNYRVLSVIGVGGMGKVYRAEQVKLKRPVCMKMLLPAFARDPAVVQRFEREGQATAAMRHPNIVSVFDVGRTEDGTLYIVMELIEGRTVRALLAEEAPLAVERALHLMIQVLSALDEAHANNVVHRDLKPSNLLVSRLRDGTDLVKVVDFGIAKVVNDPAHGTGSALTKTGVMVGTPGYMSPEQLLGQQLDERSDLYSAAVIFWEMITGSRLFRAPTDAEMARAHIIDVPASPSSVARVPIPQALDVALLRALEKRASRRFKSALEFRAQLEAIRDALRSGGTVAPPSAVELAAAAQSTPGERTDLSALKSVVPEKLLTYATSLPTLAARREKRPITVAFIELIGLGELNRGDPEATRAAIAALVTELAACVTSEGGHADRVPGNCLVAAFGLRTAEEDDAVRCVRALARMPVVARATSQRLGVRLGVRAGAHTEAIASGGYENPLEDPAVADVLTVARRLAADAQVDQVRVTHLVQRLAAASFEFAEGPPITGQHQPLPTWDLVSTDEGAGGTEPIVGRAAELRALQALATQIAGRHAGGVLLLGGSGVGKTRLLREAELLLRTKGVTVARARGGRFGASNPFDLVRQLVFSLAGQVGSETVAERPLRLSRFNLGEQDLTRLEKLFSPAAADPDAAPALPEEQHLNRAVLMRALLSAADAGPFALVIDDVHLADAPSRELLDAVIARAVLHPLGVVATARPLNIESLAPKLRRLELGPFKAEDVSALLGLHLPGSPASQELADFVLERSGGNPHFARELVVALLERSSVKLTEGEWRLVGTSQQLPETLAVLIAARLDRLTPNARLLLNYGVVSGRTFSAGLVAAAVDTPLDVPAAVAECQQLGLLTPTDSAGTYAFGQAVVVDAIAGNLPASERRHIHQRLGEALERGVSAGGEPPLEAMARHFKGAQMNRKALRYLRLSAERLLERHASAQAAEAFQQCLTMLSAELPRGATIARATAKLWLELGALAVEALGQGSPREAVELADKVLARVEADQGSVARGEVLRQKALALLRLSRPQEAEPLLKEARALVSSATTPSAVAALHADVAAVLEARGELARASEELLAGFHLLGKRTPKERNLLWQFLNQLGRIHLRLDKLDQAKEFFENARGQAKQVESPVGESRALVNLAVLSATTDPTRALTLLAEASELAQRAGDYIGLLRIRYNRALITHEQGDESAARELEAVVEGSREIGWREGEALAVQALSAWRQGPAPAR